MVSTSAFFNNAVFDIEGKLAGALLRSAPAYTVRKAADVLNLFCLNPFALFGYGSRTVVGPFMNAYHVFYFMCILHRVLSIAELTIL